MDDSKIIILLVVIVLGIALVFGFYFLFVYLYNRRHEKKINTIFDTDNLVLEGSLMNVLDEKKNIDFNGENNGEKFVLDNGVDVDVATTKSLEKEVKINPFDVDLTKRTRDNIDYVKEEEERKNKKFFT